jgi:endonuclease YncB( thermonuclease family)
MKFKLLIFSIIFPLITYSQKVVRVIDGDTYDIMINSNIVRVRMYGIDCPEKKQDYGLNAKSFAESMLLNKDVKLDISSKDLYGRSICKLYLGDIYFNKLMIDSGYAWHYAKYSKDKYLAASMNIARLNKIGLWSKSGYIEPEKFRNKK